jgi:ribosome-associated heat shock protein Hsp15
MVESSEDCRIDIWLWRARFVKTRGLAARLVEEGVVRLTRNNQQSRLDKPSRSVRPGDVLTMVLNERVVVLRVEGLGDRRGPAEEARGLYSLIA